jgi:DNA-binding transcriptional LysR family regulator
MDRLSAMETFIRVVDTGSFSAAARQLRIGQPAVSKAVAQLEQRIGSRLLLRSSRGLATTEAGQHFYERVRRVLAEAEEAELAARGAAASLNGRLRFSAAVTFARLHIIPRLPQFMARHPGLTIEAVLDDRHIDPVEAGIDVILRMGQLPDSSLVGRKIGESPLRVVATPAYFAQAGQPAVPSDLARHRAIIYGQPGGGNGFTFRHGSIAQHVVLNEKMRLTAAEGVREAVLAGLGIAVVSEWMLARELASGAVSAALPDWTLPAVGLWALFPGGRRASAKARAFADFVTAILADGSERAGLLSPPARTI